MIQPPNPQQFLGSLSSIIGVKQQQQNLQTGLLRQGEQQAETQQAQQRNSELQALAQYTRNASQDPSYQNGDGSLNVDKFQRGAMAVAPTYGQAYIGQATSNANGAVENRSSLLKLTGDQRAAAGNAFAPITDNVGITSREDFKAAVERARKVSSDPGYQSQLDSLLLHTPNTDGMPDQQASDVYKKSARALQVATGAASAAGSNPTFENVQTTGGLQVRQTNPRYPGGVAPVGEPMRNATPPTVVTYPNSQVGVMAPSSGDGAGVGAQQPSSSLGRVGDRPRTSQDDAPPPNAPKQTQDQFAASAQAAQNEVLKARENDGQYGTNMAIAHTIRSLSSDVNTGPGTQAWTRAMGLLTSQGGGSESISNYQTLGAFLDRQSAMLRQQMGLPETNAGQSQAQLISGNTEYQRGAIQTKNNLNEALTEGAHLYRQGLDRVEGFSGNASPRAVQQFKSAWTANFDPTAQEYRLAMQRGDTETARKISAGLTPQQRQALAQKGRAIDALAQGQMPQ